MNYQNRIIALEYHDAGSLDPHPGNWRNHGKAQVEALRGVLSEVGIAGALLAYRSARNGGKLTVIDGHLRRDAAPQQWPVLVLRRHHPRLRSQHRPVPCRLRWRGSR